MSWPWRRRPRLPHVEVMRVRPGDTLVFTSEHPLSASTADNIKARFHATNPHLRDVHVLVVDGLGLSVIRRDEVAS